MSNLVYIIGNNSDPGYIMACFSDVFFNNLPDLSVVVVLVSDTITIIMFNFFIYLINIIYYNIINNSHNV